MITQQDADKTKWDVYLTCTLAGGEPGSCMLEADKARDQLLEADRQRREAQEREAEKQAKRERRQRGLSRAEVMARYIADMEGAQAAEPCGCTAGSVCGCGSDPELAEDLRAFLDPAQRVTMPQFRELSDAWERQTGWPKSKPDETSTTKLLNESLASAERDPRVELRDKATKLAEADGLDFLLALDQVKAQEPELVERIRRHNEHALKR